MVEDQQKEHFQMQMLHSRHLKTSTFESISNNKQQKYSISNDKSDREVESHQTGFVSTSLSSTNNLVDGSTRSRVSAQSSLHIPQLTTTTNSNLTEKSSSISHNNNVEEIIKGSKAKTIKCSLLHKSHDFNSTILSSSTSATGVTTTAIEHEVSSTLSDLTSVETKSGLYKYKLLLNNIN